MRERNTKAEVWGQSLILAFALICTAGAHVTHSSETNPVTTKRQRTIITKMKHKSTS